ncbi:MAG: hypothetical protein IPQ13_06080 [Holophagaceae bacterium]|nr:hypothetical protein [Holophagaceae bacterium]
MMEIPKTSDPGRWNWLLICLLIIERTAAWFAFPLNDPAREVEGWETGFWAAWGLGGLLAAAVPLLFRKRAGGWLSALSGFLLLVRSCIPLLGEKPAADAVVAIMITSATLTFAFLYDQSFWPASGGDGAAKA